MNKKCPKCKLVNYSSALTCKRCGSAFRESDNISINRGFLKSSLLKRAVICLLVCIAAILGFYATLVFSAESLQNEERKAVQLAITMLEQKGFGDEAFLLKRLAVFRRSDNWLNASVEKENAFAATNFPFGIVTLYQDFFIYPVDDTERAAILLHEAKHLSGDGEKEAYEFVWKNRDRLGWSAEKYSRSMIWREVRKQTREQVPGMFVCDVNPFGDCTQPVVPGFNP